MAKTKDNFLSEKIKLFLKIIFLLIAITLGDILITLLLIYLYLLPQPNLDSSTLNQDSLYLFLLTLFITIYHIGIIGILSKKIQISTKEIAFKNYILAIILGMLVGILYNLIVLSPFDKNLSLVTILNVGIIGPILEEFLFRGWVYQKLQKLYSNNKAKWLTTSLFAVSHGNIIKIIYAFLIGTILIDSYQKTEQFKILLCIHISANLSVLLLYPYVVSYRIIGIILGIPLLLLYIFYIKKTILLK